MLIFQQYRRLLQIHMGKGANCFMCGIIEQKAGMYYLGF